MDSPSAGRAAGGRVYGLLAADPVAVEVGGGVVRAQAFPVALADLGEDIDPVTRLHTVVRLDVERPLWLDDLEHLEGKDGQGAERVTQSPQKEQKLYWHSHTAINTEMLVLLLLKSTFNNDAN